MLTHALDDSSFQSRFNILVVTDNLEKAKTLAPACQRRGQELVYCLYNGDKIRGAIGKAPDAVLMVLTDFIEHAPRIKSALRQHFGNITLPYIGALFREGRYEDQNTFDSIIYTPAHAVQISQRVEAVLRLQRMEREILQRVQTYNEDFGINCDFSLDAVERPFNILFVGKATPSFMSILNALQNQNVNVTAAFSSYSAFNFLHDDDFDAVVMNALEDKEASILIIETMRRNSRLYDVPVIFLAKDSVEEAETIYNYGVHDIIQENADMPELRGRILEAANFHRIQLHMKKSLRDLRFDGCIDLASGMFNRTFLLHHLDRIVAQCREHKYELSLIALKVQPNAPMHIPLDKIAQAENQVGGMIRSLLRSQDISARIAKDTFILVFPEQRFDTLDPIVQRISGIVDCAAFDSGQNGSSGPFTMTIDSVKVSRMPHETAEQVLTNALSELTHKHEPISRTG